MAAWLIDQIIDWLAKAVLAALEALWGLLAQTAFTSPDVTGLPQVATISGRSLLVVNTVFVLAIITVGVTVMTHETVQVRYGVGDLVPRMVVGFICRELRHADLLQPHRAGQRPDPGAYR